MSPYTVKLNSAASYRDFRLLSSPYSPPQGNRVLNISIRVQVKVTIVIPTGGRNLGLRGSPHPRYFAAAAGSA